MLNLNTHEIITFSWVFSGIDRDLAPFASGITREMLEKAKDKGAHYQIIDHKLYREEKCMFPFRYVYMFMKLCTTFNRTKHKVPVIIQKRLYKQL